MKYETYEHYRLNTIDSITYLNMSVHNFIQFEELDDNESASIHESASIIESEFNDDILLNEMNDLNIDEVIYEIENNPPEIEIPQSSSWLSFLSDFKSKKYYEKVIYDFFRYQTQQPMENTIFDNIIKYFDHLHDQTEMKLSPSTLKTYFSDFSQYC